MTWDKKFPFNAEGSMVAYDGSHYAESYLTQDEARTTTTLTYATYVRGRSASGLVFKDAKGRRYQFFMTHAHEIIPLLVNGKITGTFAPVKMGQNFGWRKE